MNKFQPANYEVNPEKFDAMVRKAMEVHGIDRQDAERFIKTTLSEPVFLNDTYQVSTRGFRLPDFGGDWVHLSIKRIDREAIRDWRDLQEIKNQLVGEENEGIELFPAESRRVDTANQYHLFVLKKKGQKIPIGFNERWIMDHDEHDPVTQVKQRPFKSDDL